MRAFGWRFVPIGGIAVLFVLCGGRSASSAPAIMKSHSLTFYAVVTRAQFVNHADDRARGDAANPFNADTKALAPVSQSREKGKGPFPGDDVLYKFKLYRAPNLKSPVGSAVYTCVYNFSQHALCEGSYQLTAGTMFASGPVDFNSNDFTLAVTGGTGGYIGNRGQVVQSSGRSSGRQERASARFHLQLVAPVWARR